ncbi:hypothetical protein RvY_03755 [Ramazzottius varieornatus]|uniref:Uncharacterized protein n=1 Tax=Ramazzottius varieornatus TaxID=947166 RepID=A0A1D1UWA1_RAMVA|nr:hypothetical protein RvY_03755 [Ramazzottius varieornatus]
MPWILAVNLQFVIDDLKARQTNSTRSFSRVAHVASVNCHWRAPFKKRSRYVWLVCFQFNTHSDSRDRYEVCFFVADLLFRLYFSVGFYTNVSVQNSSKTFKSETCVRCTRTWPNNGPGHNYEPPGFFSS